MEEQGVHHEAMAAVADGVVRTSLASTLAVGTAGGSGAVAAVETKVARKVAEESDYGAPCQSHADGALVPLNSGSKRVGAALSLLETAFYFLAKIAASF